MNDSSLISEVCTDEILNNVARKVQISQRITNEEAIYLYEHGSLGFLGSLANLIRERKHGDKTYFNRNFHIEPTNICVYSCSFCSYSRLIKKREEGWEYTDEQIMDIVRTYDNKEVTEVHIVGGVLPQYDLKFYTDLFKKIKAHRPELHIKALTPVEFHYIFKKAKMSYEEGMKAILDSGVDSLPGGGAEIFDEEIREKIAGGKCSSDEWLRIHEIWHELGKRSNATMLYGHIETFAHRVDHMDRLRQLQDKTKGFQTFIPLKFRNKDNEMSHLPESSIVEDLRNYAIARIYLDNFDHIKAYWPMLGRHNAQLTEEQSPSLNTEELVQLIKTVNRKAIERDSIYNELKDYTDVVFDNANALRYYSLPIN